MKLKGRIKAADVKIKGPTHYNSDNGNVAFGDLLDYVQKRGERQEKNREQSKLRGKKKKRL